MGLPFKKFRVHFVFSVLLFSNFTCTKAFSDCDCYEKEMFVDDFVIDFGDRVIFPGFELDVDPEEIFSRNVSLEKVPSRAEILKNASYHYKEGMKELKAAKKILEGEKLFYGEIESL